MPKAEIGQAVQLLDLMLEFFADDGHWTRGSYDDGDGGHCLVGALLHLSRKHRLPAAPVIALLQDAMPCPGVSTLPGSTPNVFMTLIRPPRLAHAVEAIRPRSRLRRAPDPRRNQAAFAAGQQR
jgi:hypothetical protein